MPYNTFITPSTQMTIRTILDETIKEAIENSNDSWKGSPFEPLTKLTNDERGRWGEKFLFRIIKEVAGIDSTWDGDCNTRPEDGGTYDILVNLIKKLKNEVKTAFSCTKSANWQHENIYAKSVWDKLTFVDVDYDKIYITVLTPANMEILFQNEKDPIFGKKATLREAQEDKWKFDFSRVTIKNAIAAGYTFCYNVNNPDDAGLVEHLLKHFN
jgi:hypothetical protein